MLEVERHNYLGLFLECHLIFFFESTFNKADSYLHINRIQIHWILLINVNISEEAYVIRISWNLSLKKTPIFWLHVI